jgi:hypothetical protein
MASGPHVRIDTPPASMVTDADPRRLDIST